jgi:hypothetical protein
MTIALGAADAAAPLLGKVATLNVIGTSLDPTVPVSSTSVAVEVLGAPGQVDPARGGALSFDPQQTEDDTLIGLPIHTADFVGTTLAVAATTRLLTLADDGQTSVSELLPGDAGLAAGGATAVAAGTVLNVVATELTGSSPLTFEDTLRRGPLGALVVGPRIDGGFKCAIDRDGRRVACRTPSSSGGAVSYASPLRTLEGSTPGTPIHDINDVDVSTILHTTAGWALVGTRLPYLNQPVGWFVELVDDAGNPVPGFAFATMLAPNTGLADATADAAGLLIAGADAQGAVVVRCDWTGSIVSAFASAGTLRVPGAVTLRLGSSAGGLLAAALQAGGGTRLTRFDAKTGAIDKSFGNGGTVALAGTVAPIAVAEANGRIYVASLTATGAQVAVLFP